MKRLQCFEGFKVSKESLRDFETLKPELRNSRTERV